MVSTTLDPPIATSLPTRSYTYPLQTRNKKKAVNKSEPFDPEELCRRLEKHRQEQKEARRRRRAQASDKNGEPAQYHHVPQCAAASFARTATPESLKKNEIHKLSRQVIRTQPPAVDSRAPLAKIGPSIRTVVEGHEMSRLKTEAIAERNQFQRTSALEEAAQADQNRNLNRPQQRGFEIPLFEELPTTNSPPNKGDFREWDPLGKETYGRPSRAHGPPNANDRHDWAQRDECGDTDRHGLRDRMTPFSEAVRRLGGGKGRVSPKSAADAIGDDTVDDSEGKNASRRKSSFLSRPLFRKQ
ncbi:MAG: hypothetical protein LQ347_000543 [Umbilicaria vellea]|nr:MAG: hypothetical protein LQ347_000543 [Umbilicaria vellea]